MATQAAPVTQAADTLSGGRATLSALIAMARKEFTIMTRYPVEFVASFVQIFAIVAIFTLAGLTFTNPEAEGLGRGGTVAGVVIYGFILFMYLSDTLWTIGYNVRREQKQGTLEALYLSPASKFASLVSRVTTNLIWTSALAIAGMALMTAMLGRLPFHNQGLALYILVFALAGTFGIGFAFAAVTLRVKETAQSLANVLQFSFLVLGAYFFPFSSLPAPLLAVSRLLPPAYAVDSFRSTLMDYPPGFPELAPIQTELVIVTAFGILMPILGLLWYRHSENVVRRSGGLSEY